MDFDQWNLDHDQLKQIADSLERIADSLEKLTECVDTNYVHSWLNVNGTIENYEG